MSNVTLTCSPNTSEEMPVLKFFKAYCKAKGIKRPTESKFSEIFDFFSDLDMNDDVGFDNLKKVDFYTLPKEIKEYASRKPTDQELTEILTDLNTK